MPQELDLVWHQLFADATAAKQAIPLGEMKSFRFGLQKVAIAHTAAGWFAFDNRCPHKLIALTEGVLHADSRVECRWHQYTFDLRTGAECTGKIIRDLRLYALEWRDTGLWLGLPPASVREDEFSF